MLFSSQNPGLEKSVVQGDDVDQPHLVILGQNLSATSKISFVNTEIDLPNSALVGQKTWPGEFEQYSYKHGDKTPD